MEVWELFKMEILHLPWKCHLKNKKKTTQKAKGSSVAILPWIVLKSGESIQPGTIFQESAVSFDTASSYSPTVSRRIGKICPFI